MNTLASPTETVDQMIARVLCGAHRAMCAHETPNEARTVLNVAHSFADELATLDPRFDRLQFLKAVTEDPS